MIKKCLICNKDFICRPVNFYNGRAKFCSNKCKNEFMKSCKFALGRKLSNETKEKISISRKGKYCSSNHPRWKGGRVIQKGYVFVKMPDYPSANKGGYVREHRLVMEKYLGRYLEPEERIHHLNGNKQDNRIENLQLFKNNSEHSKYHSFLVKLAYNLF